jgi:SAM-dependent methyltransferase
VTSLDHDAVGASDRNLYTSWECWWATLDGTPGEIVWDADAADLAKDLEFFGRLCDPGLPVVDFGCGNGRQSRLLARHFERVVGIDFSPSAVEHARALDNPPNVSYCVLDARLPADALRLHAELGDVNVYIRGVLQAMPPADRPLAMESLARLVGEAGTVFAKELTPEAAPYFAKLVERHGLTPGMARMLQQIPPGQITLPELVSLFSDAGLDVVATGTSHMHTVNTWPNGELVMVPAIYAIVQRYGAE